VLAGGDITVLSSSANSQAAFPSGLNSARIDAIGLQYGQTDAALGGTNGGAGGIEAQSNADNLRITNNVMLGNSGPIAGGIGLGKPLVLDGAGNEIPDGDNHNPNVQIANNRVLGNGGVTKSGALGLFGGSNGYAVSKNFICGNFGVEYGAGISHWGYSPGGSISDNQIFYNDAVDSGAGIAINDQTPPSTSTSLGKGSGAVDIDRNHLQGNYSGDDGGALFVQNALDSRVNLRNNMIVDNGAADMGGAIALDDSSNVAIANNTVANNVSTGSSEGSLSIADGGVPHAAGLASEASDPRFTGHGNFSNPVALFNNVFWNNDAFLLDHAGPGAALVDQGFIDFEVHNTGSASDVLTPRYSIVTGGTNTSINGAGARSAPPGGQRNASADPLFVDPFVLELSVAGSRLDPQQASVTITGQDPADGVPGDYHISPGSPAIDNGVRCSQTPVPLPNNPLASCTGTNRGVQAPAGANSDFDGQFRPMRRLPRGTATPWDLGADELIGTPVTL
jgi:hypothetical protein